MARYRTSAELLADAYSCYVVLAVVLAVFAAPRVDEFRDDCHLRCLLSSDVGTLLCRHRLLVMTYFAGKWFHKQACGMQLQVRELCDFLLSFIRAAGVIC